jgi:cytochrome c oxidase subunit 2
MVARTKFTPDITTKAMRERMNNPKFNYVLMCNKICGGAHYKMKMIVVVLEEKDYKKWLASKKSFKDNYFAAAAAVPAPASAAGADSTMVTKDTVSVAMN